MKNANRPNLKVIDDYFLLFRIVQVETRTTMPSMAAPALSGFGFDLPPETVNYRRGVVVFSVMFFTCAERFPPDMA